MSQKDIYNNSEYLAKHNDWHQRDSVWKYQQMQSFLAQIEFKSVADVGCGAGKILECIQQDFPNTNLNGYEVSKDILPFWKERSAEIKLHQADFLATETPFFDLVLLIDVFEHVEDYYNFLRQLKAKARFFIFHIPLDMFALASLTNNYQRKKDSVGHLHYYDKNTALGVLSDCGYKIQDFKLTKAYEIADTSAAGKLKLLRKIGNTLFGSNFNSRLLGGYSMMVLAKNEEL